MHIYVTVAGNKGEMIVTAEQRLRAALIDLREIASRHQLVNGNFTVVAKRHAIPVNSLKYAYKNHPVS
jgi:hypothetical protein